MWSFYCLKNCWDYFWYIINVVFILRMGCIGKVDMKMLIEVNKFFDNFYSNVLFGGGGGGNDCDSYKIV